MNTHRKIILTWPKIIDFCEDCDVPEYLGRQWFSRDSIPAWAWTRVMRAAIRKNIPLTYEIMALAAAARYENRNQAKFEDNRSKRRAKK